tara:strand:+ start:80 stop:457 length:378 start_codon:yes stop_codon:yes gene_type:complete
MAIRRRSLRNSRNLRSKRSRRYGGNGTKGSKGSEGSSGKKTTKVRGNKRPVRAFSQNSPPSRPPPSRPSTSRKPVKAYAVGHNDYLKVLQREYSALADLVQKHIDDSEHLKSEFNKLKSKSVFLK